MKDCEVIDILLGGMIVLVITMGIVMLVGNDQSSVGQEIVSAQPLLQVTEEYRNELRRQMEWFSDYNKLSETDQQILAHAISRAKLLDPLAIDCWEVTTTSKPIGLETKTDYPVPGHIVVVSSTDGEKLGRSLDYVIYYYEPRKYSYRVKSDGSAYRRSFEALNWLPFEDDAKVNEIKTSLLASLEQKELAM